MARWDQRKKLERLYRYISRPAVSEKRLAMTHSGRIRYQLKTPYWDGITHVFFQSLDFIARQLHWFPNRALNWQGSLVSSMILTRYVGQLKLSKFIPDEFVMVFWQQTANIVF